MWGKDQTYSHCKCVYMNGKSRYPCLVFDLIGKSIQSLFCFTNLSIYIYPFTNTTSYHCSYKKVLKSGKLTAPTLCFLSNYFNYSSYFTFPYRSVYIVKKPWQELPGNCILIWEELTPLLDWVLQSMIMVYFLRFTDIFFDAFH